MWKADIFGRKWDLPANELCFVCGQPDSCGDCNHNPLSSSEVLSLGGRIENCLKEHDVVRVKATGALGTIVYVYNGKYAVELVLGNCIEDFSGGELELQNG